MCFLCRWWTLTGYCFRDVAHRKVKKIIPLNFAAVAVVMYQIIHIENSIQQAAVVVTGGANYLKTYALHWLSVCCDKPSRKKDK